MRIALTGLIIVAILGGLGLLIPASTSVGVPSMKVAGDIGPGENPH